MLPQRSKEWWLAALKGLVRVSDAGCWLWQGTVNPDGYAILRVDGADGRRYQRTAHRLLWWALGRVEELDGPHRLKQTCARGHCLCPEHLQQFDGRAALGRLVGNGWQAKNPKARMTQAEAQRVFELAAAGRTPEEIAQELDEGGARVNTNMVRRVLRGDTWRQVDRKAYEERRSRYGAQQGRAQEAGQRPDQAAETAA